MKTQDFQGREPRLAVEEYFLGRTRAWGIFEDRFGTLRRQFVVTIDGSWDPQARMLTLDEHFVYGDGETERRVWSIRKLDEHRYEGTADGVAGLAVGESYGNALNWRYEFDLKVGASVWRVRFDDWMFLLDPDVLVNRATVSKLGFALGTVSLFFRRQAATPSEGAGLPPGAE